MPLKIRGDFLKIFKIRGEFHEGSFVPSKPSKGIFYHFPKFLHVFQRGKDYKK